MKFFRIFVVFLSFFCGVVQAQSAPNSNVTERFQQFLDAEWEYLMHEYPVWATSIGWPGQNHRWTDLSLQAYLRREAHTKEALKRLLEIDKTKLNAADRLNYDLYVRDLKLDVEAQRFKERYLQITQLNGIQQSVARTFAFMPTSTAKDFDNILARFGAVPEQIDATIVLLQEGLKQGITPPQVTLRDVPEQIKAQMAVADNPMMTVFNSIPSSISPEDQKAIQDQARRVLVDRVIPASGKLYDFFVNTYMPQTRKSIGWTELPDGRDWYEFLVKRSTTTDLTPAQIHDLGLQEVTRIRKEMEAIMREVDFEGTFKEFAAFMLSDPQFFFNSADALLAAYRDIAKRADYQLVKLFGKLPRLPYGILPVPSYAEKSQPTAYFRAGNLKNGTAGTFFANTYNLAVRPKWQMQALTLHEAVPGHHLQIALAQEQEDLPNFRRYGGYTAFVEGWGLYAESLGYEMGMYADPYSRFGQLNFEMWRAVRLVVDTGIHWYGWSRRQAIDYFKQHMVDTEHNVTVEVDRYIVWPAQALAYKIGQLKITELREYSRRQLGEHFDIRAFHDRILAHGALPLDILNQLIRDGVENEKAESK